jgi:hypothetical protein
MTEADGNLMGKMMNCGGFIAFGDENFIIHLKNFFLNSTFSLVAS